MKVVILVMIFGMMIVGNAWPHAFLSSAVPRVGSTVVTGPNELRLLFTEAVEIMFSSVKITLEGGKDIETVKIAVEPSNPQMIVVYLTTPLAPGVYVVHWRVVSVDTHKTQGDYRFTVKH